MMHMTHEGGNGSLLTPLYCELGNLSIAGDVSAEFNFKNLLFFSPGVF